MTNDKMIWKKDYGDGEYTEDLVLWVNGEPTDNIISSMSSACHVAYFNDKEVAYCDTKKEAKEVIMEMVLNSKKKGR